MSECKNCDRLRAQLSEARAAALEEAAKVAETLVGPGYDANDKMRNIGYRQAATAIRALSERSQ